MKDISAREKIRKKPEVDRRVAADCDFKINSIIAERRDDGRVFLEVFIDNLGSEWGYSGSDLPVYVFSGRKVAEGSFASSAMAFSTVTSRVFPDDRKVQLNVVVDPRDVVAETNESNNGCRIELAASETLKQQTCQ